LTSFCFPSRKKPKPPRSCLFYSFPPFFPAPLLGRDAVVTAENGCRCIPANSATWYFPSSVSCRSPDHLIITRRLRKPVTLSPATCQDDDTVCSEELALLCDSPDLAMTKRTHNASSTTSVRLRGNSTHPSNVITASRHGHPYIPHLYQRAIYNKLPWSIRCRISREATSIRARG